MIDWSAIVEAVSAVLSVCGLALALYVRSVGARMISEGISHSCKDGQIRTNIDSSIERACSLLYERTNSSDARLTHIEASIQDLPRARDLHAIGLNVAEVVGELKGMRAELQAVRDGNKGNQAALVRLEEWALRQKDRE